MQTESVDSTITTFELQLIYGNKNLKSDQFKSYIVVGVCVIALP